MDQATAEADPYNWTFFTNAGTGSAGFGLEPFGLTPFGVGTPGTATSYTARRRQEHGMVEQIGDSMAQLLTRITAYEDQLAAKNVPVSHEWGQLWGTPNSRRAVLISPGG